jgi:hypothetical protein
LHNSYLLWFFIDEFELSWVMIWLNGYPTFFYHSILGLKSHF